MKENEIDDYLAIQTTGVYEELSWDNFNYNRTESTSYRILETLMTHHKISKNDVLIDFGCGRGRILFFTHHFAQIPVIGVEFSATVYDQLLENQASYLAAHPSDLPIELVHERAENYAISPQGTLFYFFNPFSIKIFRQVLHNILDSLKAYPREATLIIYYPLFAYVNYIERNTPFEPEQMFEVAVDKGAKDRVLIYSYRPKN